MSSLLTTTNHDRDIAGLKYIYPVMSRRAGGLSIGVNLNPNNACNWRCIYCQVPELQRGSAPVMDFDLLADELQYFLGYVQQGGFFERYNIPIEQRVIKDIAISGNGEPTSMQDFERAVKLIGDSGSKLEVFPAGRFVLITNGSLIHQADVQAGLNVLANYSGEIWFKLDSATVAGRKIINSMTQSQQKLLDNLKLASQLCTTKVQTCMLRFRDQIWTESEKQAYLEFLQIIQHQQIPLKTIMLYSIARESFQPEANQLSKLTVDEMNLFAAQIKALGYDVSVSC